MSQEFTVGMTRELTFRTKPEHSARTFFPNLPDVFATPYLGGLMEQVCATLMDDQLKEGCQSVGISMNLKHLAPTPLGMEVKVVAQVTKVEGRKLTFKIEAYDEVEKIGVAEHERFIIDAAKFQVRVDEKAAKMSSGNEE